MTPYLFGPGYGVDRIYESDSTAGNLDTVLFAATPLDLIFSQSGNNLVISLYGSTDQLIVDSCYSSVANQVELFKTSGGDQLLYTQVNQLVQAMASFTTTNSMSWSDAIQDRPQDVQQILAQYWSPSQ